MTSHGDLFPVPLPWVEDPAERSLSRGIRQRTGRRRHTQLDAREAVQALNVASNGRSEARSSPLPSGPVLPNSVQSTALYYANFCVADFSKQSPLTSHEP